MLLVYPPVIWLSIVIFGITETFFGAILLFKECKKRRSGAARFTTKYLSVFSIICVASLLLSGLTQALGWFPPVCYFDGFAQKIFSNLNVTSMGFYQLSRLYYCFANSQIHSDQGYSKCLFIFMYSIGICLVIGSIVYEVMEGMTIACGMYDNGNAYNQNSRVWVPRIWRLRWTLMFIITLFVWDFLTLILYRKKIDLIQKVYTKSENEVNRKINKRIVNVLHRISIITIWYDWTVFLVYCCAWLVAATNDPSSSFYVIFVWIMTSLNPFIYAPAMYLMLDHNTQEYKIFIKWIYRLKLYWCAICCECFPCCRCRSMVRAQYQLHQITGSEEDKKDLTVTPWDTRDLSVKTKHSQMTQNTIATKDGDTSTTEAKMAVHRQHNANMVLVEIDEHDEVKHDGIGASVEMTDMPRSSNINNYHQATQSEMSVEITNMDNVVVDGDLE